MLVFTRTKGQGFCLNLDEETLETLLEDTRKTGRKQRIDITVVRVNAQGARIGIVAPKTININRTEVQALKDAQATAEESL